MLTDKEKLLQKTNESIEATKNTLIFLQNEMDQGPAPLKEATINAQIARANSDLVFFRLIRAHLNAAATVVAPIKPETQARLDELGAILDRAILAGFILSATLDIARAVIGAAEEVAAIVDNHA